jgi:rod shape-determining protein MreD
MGGFLSLPILMVAVALQTTFVPQIRFWDGGPDLIFLCVLVWSVHAPLEQSVAWALVGGIMQDLMSVAPIGMSSIGLVLIVFAVNAIARQVHRVGFVILTGLVLAGSLFQQVSVWSLFALWGFRVDLLDDFGFVIVPTIIYNLALIWPVYGFLRVVQRRVTDPRRIFVS